MPATGRMYRIPGVIAPPAGVTLPTLYATESIGGTVTTYITTANLPVADGYAIRHAGGDIFYAGGTGGRVVKFDRNTNTLTPIATLTSGRVNDIIIDSANPNLLYATIGQYLYRVDLTNNTAALLKPLPTGTAVGLVQVGRDLFIGHFTDGSIQRYNLDTAALTTFSKVAGIYPSYITYNPSLKRLVYTSSDVFNPALTGVQFGVYSLDPAVASPVPVLIAGGATKADVDGKGAAAQFKQAFGIATGANGIYSYVTEYDSKLLRRVDMRDGTVKTITGTGGSPQRPHVVKGVGVLVASSAGVLKVV